MGLLDQAGQGQPMAPELAQAAAGAGAPGPAGAAPPGGPPPGAGGPAPGGPMPGGPPPGAGGPPAGGPAPGAVPGGPMPGGGPDGPVRKVDPSQDAVEGEMPEGIPHEQATAEEQKAYETAMQTLAQVLYGNDKIANAIVDQINPEDKVSSTAKVVMLLVQQLDKKIQLDEKVVPEFTKETTGRVMELAEARHGFEYGGREQQVILGSVWEGVQELFGMEVEEARGMMQSIGGDNLAKLKEQHEGFLNG